MNQNDRLDQLIATLRQPATPSETAPAAAVVDELVDALSASKASPIRTLTSPGRLRVGTFVAAGIIGFGSVAAAGPSIVDTVAGPEDPAFVEAVNESSTPAETTPESTTIESTTIETTTTIESTVVDPVSGDAQAVEAVSVDPADVVLDPPVEASVPTTFVPVDDPDTDFDETLCAEGNHGKTVSSVAKQTTSGPGKGQIVSEAAHSSCGKQDKADKHDDDDEIETDGDDADDDEPKDKAHKKDKSDKSDKSDKHDDDDDDVDEHDDEADDDEADDDEDDDDERDASREADRGSDTANSDNAKKDKSNKSNGKHDD